MHNVIISSHVAFYTDEAVRQITQKTLENFEGFTGIMELDEKAFVAWSNNGLQFLGPGFPECFAIPAWPGPPAFLAL